VPADDPDVARAALARARSAARARPRAGRNRPPGEVDPRADRDPRLIGAAVRDLVNDRGWDRSVSAASVLAGWGQIVGPDVAAHSRPVSLVAGKLTIVAESTAWATQLRLLAPTLLSQLVAAVGPGIVRTLYVHGPAGPDWRHGPRRVAGGRGPRDTYG
jgi:predicted nucleic acid-binding Zn ribbon protein